MRGSPIAGFRLTNKRVANGWTNRSIMDACIRFQKCQAEGKPVPPEVMDGVKEARKNVRKVQKYKLLSPKIVAMHAVDKSAIRRNILL